jgi:adenylate cyclase
MAIDREKLRALAATITEAGLAGESEIALAGRFCAGAVEAGLPIARTLLIVDTLHPVYEGRVFRWQRGQAEPTFTEYGRSNVGDAAASWRRSPFYHLLETGESKLRMRLTAETDDRFNLVKELREAGMTDYLVLVSRFAAEGIVGELDCIYSSWATDAPDGFTDTQIAEMERLVPTLCLAVKCTSLGRIAQTLVETYLGRDAGRRVLAGRIERGVAEQISSVIWFSDLKGFTRITDTAPPHDIIPLLNDYADAVVSSIHEKGGEVLKLIGDGILAIFRADDREGACRAALGAAVKARKRVKALNETRAAAGKPVSDLYLGLHVGEVFYGNVGSAERLDFTVVGPAVNEASRIAAMCRSVDQPLLLSAAFAEAAQQDRWRLVSVGRYALRGIGKAQELFTLEPDAEI